MRGRQLRAKRKEKMLKRGIEPQTFALLARRSNQLSYSSLSSSHRQPLREIHSPLLSSFPNESEDSDATRCHHRYRSHHALWRRYGALLPANRRGEKRDCRSLGEAAAHPVGTAISGVREVQVPHRRSRSARFPAPLDSASSLMSRCVRSEGVWSGHEGNQAERDWLRSGGGTGLL